MRLIFVCRGYCGFCMRIMNKQHHKQDVHITGDVYKLFTDLSWEQNGLP